jgi:hypothetical protein
MYQFVIVKYVKSLYPHFKQSDGTHRLRGAYAKISHLIHASADVSGTSWAKRVLGHASLTSAMWYDSIIIDRSIENADLKERVARLEYEIENALYSIRRLQQKKRKRIVVESEEEEQ